MNPPPALLSFGLPGFRSCLDLVWPLWPFSKSVISMLCTTSVSTRPCFGLPSKVQDFNENLSIFRHQSFSRPPDVKTKKSPKTLDVTEKQPSPHFLLVFTRNIVQNGAGKVSRRNSSTPPYSKGHLYLVSVYATNPSPNNVPAASPWLLAKVSSHFFFHKGKLYSYINSPPSGQRLSPLVLVFEAPHTKCTMGMKWQSAHLHLDMGRFWGDLEGLGEIRRVWGYGDVLRVI